MRTMKNRYYLSTVAGLLSCILLIVSCKDDPSSVSEEPPTVPPASSMKMDFSTLSNQKDGAQANSQQSVENFGRAVVTGIVLKSIVEVNVAIPRALLTAANNSDAELNENEEWEWSFSRTERDTSFDVRLLASRTEQDSVNWSFYVTNPDLELDNQLFFDGTTNANGTEGVWAYYSIENTGSQEQVSHLNWAINVENDIELRLEVTSDRHGNQGDYIDYTYEDSLKTVVYYDNSEDAETEIQYNVNTKAGYIIAPNYNNGEKACWDENLQDVTCSE